MVNYLVPDSKRGLFRVYSYFIINIQLPFRLYTIQPDYQ